MPRQPTVYAKRARQGILAMVEGHRDHSPLPPLRELGNTFGVHSSTIFRLLCDLETEGIVWQGPSGRFFPARSRQQTLKGAPICFIGREMWQWSQLYQEVLTGVAEVCSSNGSPLIFQSARTLVQVPVLLEPPVFATTTDQVKALREIVRSIPRGCAGFLLDHLWTDAAIKSAMFPGGEKVQLLHGSGRLVETIVPDYRAAVEIVREYVRRHDFRRLYLVCPFHGDPAIVHGMSALLDALSPWKIKTIDYHDTKALKRLLARPGGPLCLICPEDNIALGLAAIVKEHTPGGQSSRITVLATQGTGVVTSPHSRLRFDYRRLGRAAASHILHGTKVHPVRPHLVPHEEGGPVPC